MLARDEADFLSLVLGADLTGLPPLLVSTVQHMQHIPKPEAQSLTEEATVCSLVIVKKSPEGWNNSKSDMLFKNICSSLLNHYSLYVLTYLTINLFLILILIEHEPLLTVFLYFSLSRFICTFPLSQFLSFS